MEQIAYFITLMFVVSVAIERSFEIVKVAFNLNNVISNRKIRNFVYQFIPVLMGAAAYWFKLVDVKLISEMFAFWPAGVVVGLLAGGGSSFWYNFHKNTSQQSS